MLARVTDRNAGRCQPADLALFCQRNTPFLGSEANEIQGKDEGGGQGGRVGRMWQCGKHVETTLHLQEQQGIIDRRASRLTGGQAFFLSVLFWLILTYLV